MTHGIAVDEHNIAINWFTLCGKHCILDIRGDDLNNDKVDCPQCLRRKTVTQPVVDCQSTTTTISGVSQ